LTIAGYLLDGFTVQVYGSDVMLSETTYSMVGFAIRMQNFELQPGTGTIFSQATFILFALSTIVLHMIVLLIIWYVRIKPKFWNKMHTLAGVCFAWSALDVMVLSMVITLVEMQAERFAKVSSEQLALISKLLGTTLHDENIVRLKIILGVGTWVMVAAFCLHFVVAQWVMIILHRAIPHVPKRRDMISMGLDGTLMSDDSIAQASSENRTEQGPSMRVAPAESFDVVQSS